MGQNLGLHHAHVGKRLKQGQQYPANDRWVRFVDQAIYVGAFVGPIFTLPQVLAVWGARSAAGVSIITWAAYTVAAMGWLYYGILHKDKPIIVSNALWIVMDLLIVIGALIYS